MIVKDILSALCSNFLDFAKTFLNFLGLSAPLTALFRNSPEFL